MGPDAELFIRDLLIPALGDSGLDFSELDRDIEGKCCLQIASRGNRDCMTIAKSELARMSSLGLNSLIVRSTCVSMRRRYVEGTWNILMCAYVCVWGVYVHGLSDGRPEAQRQTIGRWLLVLTGELEIIIPGRHRVC